MLGVCVSTHGERGMGIVHAAASHPLVLVQGFGWRLRLVGRNALFLVLCFEGFVQREINVYISPCLASRS